MCAQMVLTMRVRNSFAVACGLALVATLVAPLRSETCKSAGNTRLPSPDGKRELILYVRVCGERATGEVEIASKGASVPDRAGNVDVPGHPIRVSARWASNEAVFLGIAGTGSLPRALRVDGVTITFVRSPDD
jgi:hypothetical protein